MNLDQVTVLIIGAVVAGCYVSFDEIFSFLLLLDFIHDFLDGRGYTFRVCARKYKSKIGVFFKGYNIFTSAP